MLLLILKSSACLAVFMLFYKLFLEKESIHHFKRFYLLGALFVSIVIPFITFTQYIEVETTQNSIPFQYLEPSNSEVLNQEVTTTWQDYIPTILWSIYALGFIVFSIRFIKNIVQLIKKIKNNPKFKNQPFINVLLIDLIHPHTFFNYIFLNKTKYEHNLIPNEVLLHEQTHAKQKHALDILFLEVLQIVFWFNPLLYFIKKDVKLNHEFLADQAVLKHGINTKNYQNILLAYSSPDSYQDARTNQLANAINYSLIKKRFTVMKTQTSKKVYWLKGILILPILAILIYGFSEKEIVKIEPNKIATDADIKPQKHYRIITFLDKDGLVLLPNGWYSVSTLKRNFNAFHNKAKSDSTEIELLIHKKSSKSNTSLAIDILNSFGTLKTKNVDKLGWNTNHKKPNIQQQATPKQIAEYNKLAKHIKKQIANKGMVKLKQIMRLKLLYKLMSNSQKKKAESYPDLSLLPPPPPPAKKPTPIEVVEVNVSPPPEPVKIEIVEVLETEPTPVEIVEVIEVSSPNPAPKPIKVIEIVEEPSPKLIEIVETPAPPLPSKNPIDYINDMAKKGAKFFYNKKEISSKKAKNILTKNKKNIISTRRSNNNNYVVELSDNPLIKK
ncbi:hypothetical protein L3X37_07955 [Sabulilitoribacter arenilitoris]|uniref:Peptidase M56 domain-containing protein n=1 Tax=Wocania arenilitoris TaxID=2044858 RepID=A0AAE3EMU4_9FLAO|nr:M56 family metallopeptidase [Wocania arenilitoris]MCF7568295.1 hypothetical protein [Wocania arenilitoris]